MHKIKDIVDSPLTRKKIYLYIMLNRIFDCIIGVRKFFIIFCEGLCFRLPILIYPKPKKGKRDPVRGYFDFQNMGKRNNKPLFDSSLCMENLFTYTDYQRGTGSAEGISDLMG